MQYHPQELKFKGSLSFLFEISPKSCEGKVRFSILLTHFEAVLVVRTDTEKPERVTSRSKYAGRVFSKGEE